MTKPKQKELEQLADLIAEWAVDEALADYDAGKIPPGPKLPNLRRRSKMRKLAKEDPRVLKGKEDPKGDQK